MKDRAHFYVVWDHQQDSRPIYIADIKTAADESKGTPAVYYSVYATLFLGKDAYGMIDPEGGNLEMIIKDKGQVGGPLNQFSTLGYKFSSAAKILYEDRMVRVESCGAYSAEDEAN